MTERHETGSTAWAIAEAGGAAVLSPGAGVPQRKPDLADRMLVRVGRVSGHRVAGPLTVVAGVLTYGSVVWFADPMTPGHLPECPTKTFLNVVCPGCGSTRMAYSLMHGDFGAAAHFNFVALVAVALFAWSFVAYCVRLWTGRRWRTWQHLRYSSLGVIVVLGVWTVIRNIPLAPFTALRV